MNEVCKKDCHRAKLDEEIPARPLIHARNLTGRDSGAAQASSATTCRFGATGTRPATGPSPQCASCEVRLPRPLRPARKVVGRPATRARSEKRLRREADPRVHRIGGRFPLSSTQPSRHCFGGVDCVRWTPSTHRPMIRTVCPADGCDLNEVGRRRCRTAPTERGFNGVFLAACSADGKFRPAQGGSPWGPTAFVKLQARRAGIPCAPTARPALWE